MQNKPNDLFKKIHSALKHIVQIKKDLKREQTLYHISQSNDTYKFDIEVILFHLGNKITYRTAHSIISRSSKISPLHRIS